MKRIVLKITYLCALSVILPVSFYFCGAVLLHAYIESGAKKLVELENQGRLSKSYGYVWQEINQHKELQKTANTMAGETIETVDTGKAFAQRAADFPSLSAISELNSIQSLHNTIRINDRHGIPMAQLQTTHNCVAPSSLNEVLLKSLIATEDKHFYTRKNAYEYNALIRSMVRALALSLRTMKLHFPRGSSTIHMQVARFLLLKYDSRGYSYVEKSVSRKLKELKLAQALQHMYSNIEILTVYINHCVSAGGGMRGYHDISMGLFGVKPDRLSIPQSVYLSRLVKWNRHVPRKIINHIKLSMPALALVFKWDKRQQHHIQQSLDTLTFIKRPPLIPQNSYLIDLANEYWRKVCEINGMDSVSLKEIDIADPESNIRKFGNLVINLTIDYRLQKHLERMVASRGFGPDTTMLSDVKIGSFGENLNSAIVPDDTLRAFWVVKKDTQYVPSPRLSLRLRKGDTLVTNIRYKKLTPKTIRRSCYYYKRKAVRAPGQYYAYAIMDSRTCQLLAYCSRDRLGSRLRSLMVNKNPNGSSVAKPIIYALSYDFGIYQPYELGTDDVEVPDTCEWARFYDYRRGKPVGMIYSHVREDEGYTVHNHHDDFDGYDFLFNHLWNSNNILAVETMYRLNTSLTNNNQRSKRVRSFLKRFGRKELGKLKSISGPQLYGVLVSAVSDNTAAVNSYAQNYSTALGTVELSLYEQLHLFNLLYNNKISRSPSKNPSLFITSIRIEGRSIPLHFQLQTNTVFSALSRINPVHLALHKRLTSDKSDNLGAFDCDRGKGGFLSNFAKSGTTDDVIRPFNSDVADTARTGYGLWNAVLRLRLTLEDMEKAVGADTVIKSFKNIRFNLNSVPKDTILDVTIAAIGECNTATTGERNGKSLHKYVTSGLLKSFGVRRSSGFYAAYEKELAGKASKKEKYTVQNKTNLNIISRAIIKVRSGLGKKAPLDDIQFNSRLKLRGRSYRKMLEFAAYMGANSHHYRRLLKKLKNPESEKNAEEIISRITSIPMDNQILKRDIARACASLRNSIKMRNRLTD